MQDDATFIRFKLKGYPDSFSAILYSKSNGYPSPFYVFKGTCDENTISVLPSEDYTLEADERWLKIPSILESLMFENIMRPNARVEIENLRILGAAKHMQHISPLGGVNGHGTAQFTVNATSKKSEYTNTADLLGMIYFMYKPVDLSNLVVENSPSVFLVQRRMNDGTLFLKFLMHKEDYEEYQPAPIDFPHPKFYDGRHQPQHDKFRPIAFFLPEKDARSKYLEMVADAKYEDLTLQVTKMTISNCTFNGDE